VVNLLRGFLFTYIMKNYFFAVFLSVITCFGYTQNEDSLIIRKIFTEALTNYTSYNKLSFLCKEIGGRIGGAPQSIEAVYWAKKTLAEYGADTVYLQDLKVRNWKRGEKETCIVKTSLAPEKNLSVCALGGSVGTGKKGISAKVVEVKNFDELKLLGKDKIEGKIVFFNRAADPSTYSTFPAYGGAANQRVHGAAYAARYGAVAAISRSLTLAYHDYPHTGIMYYNDSIKKIPAFAISTISADLLSEFLKNDTALTIFLKSGCFENEDTTSYNVIGELKGSEHPEEIIVVSAHIDAWDNGEGAHDDGAGVVQAMEVLRIFKSLGIKLKRTLRVVHFMDEEMAQRGGRKYASVVEEKNEKHIAAIESDCGGFTPQGFCFENGANIKGLIEKWKPLLIEYGLWLFIEGHSAVDIGIMKNLKFPLFGLMTDSQRYFDHQHAPTDVFEAVNKRELQLGAASMAALVYLLDKYAL